MITTAPRYWSQTAALWVCLVSVQLAVLLSGGGLS